DGLELQYWSLVDASCGAVYAALVEVENYPQFITGVDRVAVRSSTPTSKTAEITQRVIGRQQNADVERKFDPARRTIQFDTLETDLSRNTGHYELRASPDDKRCLVHTTFLVRESDAAQSVPIGVLASGTREAFVAAAKGVKQRAAGGGTTEKKS